MIVDFQISVNMEHGVNMEYLVVWSFEEAKQFFWIYLFHSMSRENSKASKFVICMFFTNAIFTFIF